LRDAPVQLRGIPCDAQGVDVEALATAYQQAQANGERVAFFYTIPTFQNPRGVTMSQMRRQSLTAFAHSTGLRIVEDDVYRELWYDQPAPPSLWATMPRGQVIRLGSFAKSLAPGLRLGFITADSTTIGRLAESGLFDSGGGIAHFQSLVVNEIFVAGAYDAIVSAYRQRYRARATCIA
jgi:DNA-binding transcriptional MocR family regulator